MKSRDRQFRVVFETTSKCNYNCLMCYNIWKLPYIGRLKELNKSEKLRIIEIISKFAHKITFTGGEPLMLPYLSDLIEKATKLDLRTTLITNASLATEKVVRKLKAVGLETIQISFYHFTPIVFDRICGIKKGFEKTLKGAINFLKYFEPEKVWINIVPLSSTYRDLYKTGRFLYKFGVKNLTIGIPIYSGNFLHFRHEFLNMKALKYCYNQAVKLAKDLKMKVILSGNVPFCIFENFKGAKQKTSVYLDLGCRIGEKVISIGVDGECRPCIEFPLRLGNILTNPLKKILSHKVLKDFKKSTNLPSVCKNCNYKYKCRGGCLVSAINFNDLNPDLKI